MRPTTTTETDVIDHLSARLQVLEAQAVAFQDDGAEALRRLSPALISNIFLGIAQTTSDCRALVNQLDQVRMQRRDATVTTAAAA